MPEVTVCLSQHRVRVSRREGVMVIAMFKAEKRAGIDTDEYQKTAQRMMDLVTSMPGFISFKGCTTDDSETFAMATFETEEALEAWHNHPEHRATQRAGIRGVLRVLVGEGL
jgi:heme-degrading monooxygenase HmoA